MSMAIDWPLAQRHLLAHGWARLGPLVDEDTARAVLSLWEEPSAWRSTIDMARFRFGEGEYRYFASPLPAPVQAMRGTLYRGLQPIANAWSKDLRGAEYPAELDEFLARCHEAGQVRPTPLLLRYTAGGWNALHQDLYGPMAFPLQVTILLSSPGVDFEGGELLLVEQRPRAQSRATVIPLGRGEGVAFAVNSRPEQGARGPRAVKMRHGVSVVRSGERFALGIIFHDAR
jgi:hypothetical protein